MEEKRGALLRIGTVVPHQGPLRTLQLLPLILSIRDSYSVPARVNFFAPHATRMAPTKRTWDEANAGSELDAASSLQGSSSGTASKALQNQAAARDAPSTSPMAATSASASQHIPMISRKIRACASCRKHKVFILPHSALRVYAWTSGVAKCLTMQIKCIMDENTGPPCKRCAEKNLVSTGYTSSKPIKSLRV